MIANYDDAVETRRKGEGQGHAVTNSDQECLAWKAEPYEAATRR